MLYFHPSLQKFPSESVSVVADEYLGDTDDPAELRDRFQDLMGDFLFVIPALQVSKYHRGEFPINVKNSDQLPVGTQLRINHCSTKFVLWQNSH